MPKAKEGGHSRHGSDIRRPSQVSEIDSLVTVAEYMGTQYDGTRLESQYEASAAKNELPIIGEPTIGSLASEI